MLTPVEVSDFIMEASEKLGEQENLNVIKYWILRCGANEDEITEWAKKEIEGNASFMATEPLYIVMNALVLSSFLQGMLYGTQLSDISLEEIEI